ncbi:RagB/SusD family nutrient uptake outer membrane protein [Bacteroidales bacterium OttesenSCG-928-L03]|nr:RagB/SusD family nutrient uptake outer membrane protein [Bacteroidales bacterium OttesenSCG-928-L03]
MKKIVLTVLIGMSLIASSCQDWLEIYNKNEQVTTQYWKNKEDVESVLSSGYMYFRKTAPTLYDWSELRGGSISASSTARIKLQDFQMTSEESLCDWSIFYQVINMANSVLDYAEIVYGIDETYNEAVMKSHLTEAYFLRGLTYFYLVRNFGEVPLILKSYVDDSTPFNIAKSSEKEILAQIKKDVVTALETGAAKEFFEDADYWSGVSKNRGTKWGLYALMTDVCLWDEDYENAIKYADLLIDATALRRPAFMKNSEQWFSMFSEGNSNESIFEIPWSYKEEQTSGSPSSAYTYSETAQYLYTPAMRARLLEEKTLSGDASVRAEFGAYAEAGTSGEVYCIWKYQGLGLKDVTNRRGSNQQDANYIIYRMADVMLMRAEALIWRGSSGDNQAAGEIINQIRERAKAVLYDESTFNDEVDQLSMLKMLLAERDIEFAAEGKRWYDLLRFGKSANYKYKNEFIQTIVDNNNNANPSWLRSVLANNYAWYLPIKQSEVDSNLLLEQNPYYGATN